MFILFINNVLNTITWCVENQEVEVKKRLEIFSFDDIEIAANRRQGWVKFDVHSTAVFFANDNIITILVLNISLNNGVTAMKIYRLFILKYMYHIPYVVASQR